MRSVRLKSWLKNKVKLQMAYVQQDKPVDVVTLIKKENSDTDYTYTFVRQDETYGHLYSFVSSGDFSSIL